MRLGYALYAAAVAGLMAYSVYFGYAFTRVDEVKKVPKSIRDNPGAYRAHYQSHHRYYGGK